jgi:pyruvate dehydrogenase E2 component (dihydrolipoamide acetyltransferase)
MATEVVMPEMGESIAEGTITKWLVKTGDKVEKDQPLFEISTDKVDAEIPSPAAGVLLEIKADEGATVPVGEVVAIVGEEGEEPGEAPAERKEPEAEERPADLEERVRRYSSPLVRRMAKEEGVDLSEVKGTGIHGRVTKKDMEAFLAERAKAPARPAAPAARPAAAPAAAETGFSVPAYTEGEEVEIEPMTRIREITAAHMVYSKRTSAHVTTVFHMDMTKVARTRARAKDAFFAAHGTKLTFMPFIFKAVAASLRKHRQVNAAIDGTNIVYKKHINLGMAVALDRGLLVPVIRDADQLSLVGLAKTANDLADRARGKKLSPDELKGGTFTITNPGVFGSLFGTPIINQPQVAILGIGTIEKRPIVITDQAGVDALAIRTMSYFGITYDHRLVDGADADHFMNDVKAILEKGDWPELQPFLGG